MPKYQGDIPGASQCERHLLEILGFGPKGFGERKSVRCPIPGHNDQRPSAVYFPRTGRFHCSVCTPGRAITIAELGRQLGYSTESVTKFSSTESSVTQNATRPSFSPADAGRVWSAALARARDDTRALDAHTREVHEYLKARSLSPAWEESLFGILADDMELPEAVSSWPRRGYKLVAPLLDARSGEIVNVQARAVQADLKPRTLFPKGSQAQGTIFASRSATALLRGEKISPPRNSSPLAVIVGEGLTDFLALAIHAAVPVFSAPGAGATIGALGPWARGRTVCLAVDCDPAGEAVVIEASRAAYRFGARVVRRIEWPAGSKDACDALGHLGEEKFQTWLDAFVAE